MYVYSKACVVIKRKITVKGTNANNRADKILNVKNNDSFRSCISKNNNTFIEH